VPHAVLTRHALNRALLARQLLLEPADLEPLAAIEHLVGMQAQEPQAPYLGLWTRLRDFDPRALSGLLESRRAVRAGLMRWTIHLVSADDYARLWPLVREVAARGFRGSPFSKQLGGAAVDDVVAAGHELLVERPLSRAELAALLAERFTGADPASLAMAATVLAPVVQVPPRGLWRAGGQARWAPAEQWLDGAPRERSPGAFDGDADRERALEALARRYLAAFGPASARDMQAWSGLTRLAAIFERMRPELRCYRDAAGTELFDLPDAPLPDPDTPAPPRLLAPFDNAILGHAERSRIISAEHRRALVADRLMRTFLIDGFVAGTWQLKDGELRLRPFAPLPGPDRDALVAEAERTAAFLAPGGDGVGPSVTLPLASARGSVAGGRAPAP